ncbi:DNA primase [Salmonella enterica]|nr:DNA primase [Salmonella enterica subsp. enterica serovar Montevideo]EBU2832535.1 DNA primase [Salmonella enterica]EDS0148040.1 DNA primase [Salmonella enterica subsp. diarizonae]EBY4630882.1 DNA primase [Salmonella enterica subsp. enterica serovar Montevideo]ECC8488343.1 DNA primase [Salmonella enterica]
MRISPLFLSKLKGLMLISVLVSESVVLIKRGEKYKGLCPFHNDKNPSMDIDDAKGRYKCWVCGEEGDIFDWERKINTGGDFYAAVRSIAIRLNEKMPDEDSLPNDKRNVKIVSALYRAQYLYRHGLAKNSTAVDYLAFRGFTSKTVELWELGVVSKGVISILRKKFSDDVLISSGIAKRDNKGDLYDCLRQRITIPLKNRNGTLVGFAGRKLFEWDESPKYLNLAETNVFTKGELLFGLDKALPHIYKANCAVIVEGYFDVISLHQAGEQKAVAGMGTAITEHQLNTLMNIARTLIFCFDNDNGGARAIRCLLPKLLGVITDKHTVRFNFLDKGYDPDEYIKSKGLVSWSQSCEQSLPLSFLLMQYITSNFKLDSLEDKQRAAIRATEVCNSIKKARYLKQLLMNKVKNELGIIVEVQNE